MTQLERRAFLALGVGALAWACGRSSDDPDAIGPTPAGPGDEAISIQTTGPQVAVGDTRQAVAILRGQKPIAPKNVEIRLTPPNGRPFDVGSSKQQIRFGVGGDEDHEHPEGTEVVSIYPFRHDFDAPGVWDVDVSFDGGEGRASFQVIDETPSPKVGDKAISVDSPTTGDALGVDPICTRDPECDMHELSIKDALANDKPSVIIFATPAFCQSRTCGPIVDLVEAQIEDFGDDVNFVHVEVWRNDDDAVGKFGDGNVEAFLDWKLETEPFIFFVDANGTIKDRWVGAVGMKELATAVEDLAG